jgi:hypothetical protein
LRFLSKSLNYAFSPEAIFARALTSSQRELRLLRLTTPSAAKPPRLRPQKQRFFGLKWPKLLYAPFEVKTGMAVKKIVSR